MNLGWEFYAAVAGALALMGLICFIGHMAKDRAPYDQGSDPGPPDFKQ